MCVFPIFFSFLTQVLIYCVSSKLCYHHGERAYVCACVCVCVFCLLLWNFFSNLIAAERVIKKTRSPLTPACTISSFRQDDVGRKKKMGARAVVITSFFVCLQMHLKSRSGRKLVAAIKMKKERERVQKNTHLFPHFSPKMR